MSLKTRTVRFVVLKNWFIWVYFKNETSAIWIAWCFGLSGTTRLLSPPMSLVRRDTKITWFQVADLSLILLFFSKISLRQFIFPSVILTFLSFSLSIILSQCLVCMSTGLPLSVHSSACLYVNPTDCLKKNKNCKFVCVRHCRFVCIFISLWPISHAKSSTTWPFTPDPHIWHRPFPLYSPSFSLFFSFPFLSFSFPSFHHQICKNGFSPRAKRKNDFLFLSQYQKLMSLSLPTTTTTATTTTGFHYKYQGMGWVFYKSVNLHTKWNYRVNSDPLNPELIRLERTHFKNTPSDVMCYITGI